MLQELELLNIFSKDNRGTNARFDNFAKGSIDTSEYYNKLTKSEMAAGPSSSENHLSCQICFENFEEDGDHIPRILPCLHTVCEKCVKGMIQENKIICPECREEHEAKKEEKSFQQNKYIVVQLSRKKKRKGRGA